MSGRRAHLRRLHGGLDVEFSNGVRDVIELAQVQLAWLLSDVHNKRQSGGDTFARDQEGLESVGDGRGQ